MYTRLPGTGFIYLIQEEGTEVPVNPVPFLRIQRLESAKTALKSKVRETKKGVAFPQ